MANETTEIYMPWALYLVCTDPENPDHHGLHTNTAPYLLTQRPGRGDKIAAVIEGAKFLTLDGCVLARLSSRVRLSGHPGRSALLGEDTLDEAHGRDALSGLVPELLTDATWQYAPVAAEDLDTQIEEGKAWAREWRRGADGTWTEKTIYGS